MDIRKTEVEYTNMADNEKAVDENACSNSINMELADTPCSNLVNKHSDITTIPSQIEKSDNMTSNISFKIPGLPSKIQIQPPNKKPVDKAHVNVQPTSTETKFEGNTDQENAIESKNINESLSKDTKTASHDTKEIKYNKLSPAEQLKQSQAPIPYKEPSWSGSPDDSYSFDVLKSGVIIETIKLEKPYYVFGRLPSCDVTMDHPSLSRYHAVVQFCKVSKDGKEKGWYLYDLDSTHGTWINKNKTFSRKYYRIRVGHMLKFGGSTRLHILQGPECDEEKESDLSVSEMKEQREKQLKEAEILRLAELAEEERKLEAMKRKEEETGCSWGIGDDAEEEPEESAFSELITPEMEALYIDDPKKALKGYFEREGHEAPEYDVAEAGRGKYKCTVELPIDTPTGEPVMAEAVVSGKKRDAVIQCALEACRLLDRQGLLRASKHESHKRKKKNWEDDDFYDSDEDLYLDRTGNIEKKRQQRMKKAGKMESKAETYDSLMEKHSNILREIKDIEAKLEKAKADAAAMQDEEVDALDAYMSAIKSGMMDTKTKMKLKRQLMELRQEEAKVRKLVNIAKPASLPELQRPDPTALKKAEMPKALPVISKVKKLTSQKLLKKPVQMPQRKSEMSPSDDKFQEEEEEEDDEEKDIKTESYKTFPWDSVLSDQIKKSSSSDKYSVVKGPCGAPETPLSPGEAEERSKKNTDTPLTEQLTEPQHRKRHHQPKYDKKMKKQKTESVYDDNDPDYAVWMPPKNQSGDGKTHLNEKFGY